jgi:signal transduction histidine kinase/ActR/RegA family two-component response regulator
VSVVEQLTAERDRLYQLVMEAPIAIAILRGAELEYEVVNEHFERIFGGRKLRGLKHADIDPEGAYAAEVGDVYRTGKTLDVKGREVEFDWTGTGKLEKRYFDYTLAPMRDESGAISGVMSFTVDVTDHVLARHKLTEARTQAELANRSKDEFLAMLGHELRNPLAPILTALQLMQLRAPDVFERERAVIERQVKHVVRLVDDLLDVSRITRGKTELHKELVDLADVVAKAIEQASPLLEERDHSLGVFVPRGLFVDGDTMRLEQVISNLVTNAAKYTERGGRIDVTGSRRSDAIELRVRDNGIGIAKDMLPHIFEMFVQERQALDRARGGLGLGLAIVRSLVELHGGTVSVASEGPGKGSEFTVRLPAADPDRDDVRARLGSGKMQPMTRRQHVLVVDDNPDALHMLADALEQRGYTTSRAHDGPSALEEAARCHPAIALLDIGLPVMDGYELARRLREGDHDLKLVAVTGYGHPSARSRSKDAGFAAHLVKPITVDEVEAAIDSVSQQLSE